MRRLYRKVIRIRAEDSPNVIVGLWERKLGRAPSHTQVVPGVLSYELYCTRRQTWDAVRQTVGLDARFWEGADLLLCPPDWLSGAEDRARQLDAEGVIRKALAIGIDPAEGGDKTSMAAIDHLGLIELVSMQTPDTNVIVSAALDFWQRHGVDPENVCFDRGGGGKQHADRLRAQGYAVRTVGFGESLTPTPQHGKRPVRLRRTDQEERYAYFNRRAEMYGRLRDLIDPGRDGPVFALPGRYTNLFTELAPIPLRYDAEGRLRLPPKNKSGKGGNSEPTLVEIIGHSPDEADALVVALHCLYGVERPMELTAF